MRLLIIGFIVVFTLVVYKAFFLDSTQHKNAQAVTFQNDPATAFQIEGNATSVFPIEDTEGMSYSVAQYGDRFVVEGYDNKVVIFNFFATYCPGCKKEIPMLVDLKKKYGDSITVLGIAVDRTLSKDRLQDFKEDFNGNYSMAVGAQSNLEWTICSKLPRGTCTAIPLTMVYSKGKLQTFKVGVGNDVSYIEKIILGVSQ